MEEWKDIYGFNGMYSVSRKGKIKSIARIDEAGRNKKERLLTPDCCGSICFYYKSRKKRISLSRLVHEAFIGALRVDEAVMFKDGNKKNCIAENLYTIDMHFAKGIGGIRSRKPSNTEERGIHKSNGKYQVNIYLGSFDTIEEAREQRNLFL